MIRTIVVDDDFRVAEVHAEYVRQVDGFTVVGVGHSLAQARGLIAEHRPDLVLLDLYLPDGSGLDLLNDENGLMHTIVVTAARDVDSVRTAMVGGAAHYLVKPFRRAQLMERLESVRQVCAHLSGMSEANQAEIDRVFRMSHPSAARRRLPKGITAATLRLVSDAVGGHPDGVTSAQLADEIDVSRATLQRYLSFLADRGDAERTLQYGELGRPVHVFRLKR